MGAILTDDVPVKELLKGTGYNVPESMMDKTWGEAASGGGDVTLIELSATENKVYTPDEGKAFNKVTVNVPSLTLETLNATENKTYTPEAGKAFNEVVVNVPGSGGEIKWHAWQWVERESVITAYTVGDDIPAVGDSIIVCSEQGLNTLANAITAVNLDATPPKITINGGAQTAEFTYAASWNIKIGASGFPVPDEQPA